MSLEKARAFFEKVDKDPAVQDELKKTEASILEIAEKFNFEFTAEELRTVLRERYAVKTLDESEDFFTLK